jgi:dipeptidyl aminopeptidase/acylaminoacyl peptidase
MRVILRGVFIFWAVTAVAVFPLLAEELSRDNIAELTFNDIVESDGISTPVQSPDGREFALIRNGQIVVVAAIGGWPTTLTTAPGGKSSLDWSPDGSFIAFASEGRIWSVRSKGGQPVALTAGRAGTGDPRRAADAGPQWSPKGKWILFETGRRGNTDVAVVREDGLALNILTSTPSDEGGSSWSPDGTRIAYVERSPEYFSGRLMLAEFDPDTGNLKGEPRLLYEAEPDRGGGWSIRRPVWSPDGKNLAVVLQNSGWDKIYLIPVAGGAPRALTLGESEDGAPVFSPDGQKLAFLSNRETPETNHVWVVSVSGGNPYRLTPASPAIDSNPRWSPDGRQIYFVRSSPFESTSLLVAESEGGATPRFLIRTQARNFSSSGLSVPEVVHYASKDGLGIAAVLYKPLHFEAGKRYPAVLWIHGGPEGQDTLGWDPWALFLAQKGFLVLKPNYRGSSGYGAKFRNLNVEDSGGGEVDDVAAGAQFLVSQGLADPERLGIGGGSHGGTMVAYEVTKNPDLFKVAIELYGVTDRATYVERTNYSAAIRWMKKMGGSPEEKPEVYRKANILPDVPKITTPILIMHGEIDPQVPPFESQQFADALKKAGKTHFYITYPKELHGFSQREHRLDALKKQLVFLKQYLQPEFGRGITSIQNVVLDEP